MRQPRLIAIVSLITLVSLCPCGLAGSEQATVVAAGAEAGDRGGNAVAMAGEILVVGSLQGGPDDQGEVAIYRRRGCDWFQQQTLHGPGGGAFGRAVARDGGTLVVSAPGATVGDVEGLGAVYVYEDTGSAWSLVQTLVPVAQASNQEFGAALSLSEGKLAVGAPSAMDEFVRQGAVTVYVRTDGVWAAEQVVLPDAASAFQAFGGSVAIDGDTLAVGAVPTGASDDPSGAVHVFTADAGVWTQQAKIIPAGSDVNDAIGSDVDLEGDTLLIGAYGDDHSGLFLAGAAYVYTRDAGAWTQEAMLIAETPLRNSYFGEFVALDGDVAVVAAPRTPVVGGEVHVFTRTATVWSLTSTLSNPDVTLGTNFGEALDVSFPDLVVGWDGYDEQRGAAVVFQPGAAAAPPTAFVAPKKVTLNVSPGGTKRTPDPGFSASGTLDTGVGAVDLTLPGTLRIGGREIEFAGGLTLSSNGKEYAGESGGASLTLEPDKKGSSETKLDLVFDGDLVGDAAPDGILTFGYSTDEFDAVGTIQIADGSWKRGKVPGSVAAPSIDVRKAKATIKGVGKDKLDVTLGFASSGAAPQSVTDFGVVFGAFEATVPAASFVPKSGEKVEFKGDIDGVTKITIDYAKGEIKIKVRKATLGVYDENGAPALVQVEFDGMTRSLAFRIGGTGTKKRQY